MSNNIEITTEYLDKVKRPIRTPVPDQMDTLIKLVKECEMKKEENKDGK